MNPISSLLVEELKKRKSKNQSYSLRALARILELEPSALSKLMKGQRLPTEKTISRITEKLKVSESDLQNIQNWIKAVKKEATAVEKFASFEMKDFEDKIQNFHLVLLEALRIPVFAENVEGLRKSLQMDTKSFYEIISDLEKMHMLNYSPKTNSVSILREHNTTFPHPFTTEKRREIQKKFLSMAIKMIDQVPFEERENSTLTIAIPTSKIPEFKNLFAKMRRRVNVEADKNLKKADAVYNFTIAFYPAIEK